MLLFSLLSVGRMWNILESFNQLSTAAVFFHVRCWLHLTFQFRDSRFVSSIILKKYFIFSKNPKQTETTQVRTSSVKSPCSKDDVRERKLTQSSKGDGKSQRQLRKTPKAAAKPTGETSNAAAKPTGKTSNAAAKPTGKTPKAAGETSKAAAKSYNLRWRKTP